MCIQWDFSNFGASSIFVLDQYANSDSDAFVLSPYRHIITYKWNCYFWFFFVQSMMFWSHVVFYYLFFVNPQNTIFRSIDIIILIILIVYEFLDIMASWKTYLKDIWNYFDLFTIFMCSFFLYLSKLDPYLLTDEMFRLFLVISIGRRSETAGPSPSRQTTTTCSAMEPSCSR